MRAALPIILALWTLPALAGPQPEQLGKSGNWTAFQHGKNDTHVCYIASAPIKSEGKYKKRDQVFLMVTHRPGEKTRNVVSHIAGYPYDAKTAIVAEIGRQHFVMVPNGDTAWTPNQKTDDILTKALREGKTLKIIGKSARGTQTTDVYDLSGISKALSMIDKACGLIKKKN